MTIINGLSQPDDATLWADICIIGGGPAGITLAHRLMARTGQRILLVESGAARPRRATESLNAAEMADPRLAAFASYRRRALGGSSLVWGGRCVPFDRLDFEPREHVPNSGWPISRDALDPYYDIALRYCEAGPAEFDCGPSPNGQTPDGQAGGGQTPNGPAGGGLEPLIRDFVSTIVRTDSAELYSPPTNFGRAYGGALRRAKNVGVLTHLTCVHLDLDPASGRVATAQFRTLTGKSVRVAAGRFVLAAGGLENYRLLALSNDVQRDGLGNSGGQLGRCFMTHIEGTLGCLTLDRPDGLLRWQFHRTSAGAYARRRLSIYPEAQTRNGAMNFVVRLHHAPVADPAHRNAILSAMYLSKSFLIPEYRAKLSMIDRLADAELADAGLPGSVAFWGGHLRNISGGLPRLTAFAAKWFGQRHLAYRRIPYVVVPGGRDGSLLEFNAEQAPHPDNRLSLGDKRDRLGMPQIKIDWSIRPADIESIVVNYRLMRAAFDLSGVARLSGDEAALAAGAQRFAPVGGHYLGATRMSRSPATGVVNADCRLHDLPNVYVAGSSVFPTSGHANPTLTIVAMAARLADYLAATPLL